MADQIQELNNLRAQAAALLKMDITYPELGTTSGFHDAEREKTEVCKYVIAIIEKAQRYLGQLNSAAVAEAAQHIRSALNEIDAQIKNIDQVVKGGVHDPSFPGRRTDHTARIAKQSKALQKNLSPLDLSIRVAELGSVVTKEYLETSERELTQHVEEAKRLAGEAKKVLDAVQAKTVQKGVEESAGTFSELKEHHSGYATVWGVLLFLASLGLIWAVHEALVFQVNPDDTLGGLVGFLKRLALISIPAVFMRLTLVKYNAERNLRIIYGHREKVLDQYRTFEAGIGDDVDAKNQFRLEIAKYIFSDPATGYTGAASAAGTEINISPILSGLDRIARQKSP
jgi:hypothetical protein